MRRSLVRSGAVVIAAVVTLASCSSDGDSASVVTATPSTDAVDTTDAVETTAPAGDFDPYAQTLEWTECDAGECAEVTVPIDYDDPSVGTTTIAMNRRAASGDKIGTLFLNPGGPGGSGLQMTGPFVERVSSDVSDAYDVVGFDPRGVGSSDPLGCLDSEQLDTLLSTDIDTDDPASVDAYAQLVEAQGNACLSTNPELAKHVTTVETAKDLDVLRALVGDDQINYYGASYGTFLGTTYAALFPDRVGRLVLDGAKDPSLSGTEEALAQAGGFQLAFGDYAADCVANACELGATVDEIDQQVADLLATAAADPLPTDDTARPLTQILALSGLAEPLYVQDDWPMLTDALTAGFAGDGTALLTLADLSNGRSLGEYDSNQSQAQTAINCLDNQIAPEPDSTPTQADFVAASALFGSIIYAHAAGVCSGWPIEPTVTAPDYTAAGAAPILVVGTTGDPATPFESAQKLVEVLESGVLLIRDGDGHTAYFSGNNCISNAIDRFLVDGTVPAAGTECADETESATTTDEGVASGEPSGTVSVIAGGETVFEGEIIECSIATSDVSFTAQGEVAILQVTTNDDGTQSVVISGGDDFTGSGTAVVDTDSGDVTIIGEGSPPSGSVQDLLVLAVISSC